jgi:hypothetical protein
MFYKRKRRKQSSAGLFSVKIIKVKIIFVSLRSLIRGQAASRKCTRSVRIQAGAVKRMGMSFAISRLERGASGREALFQPIGSKLSLHPSTFPAIGKFHHRELRDTEPHSPSVPPCPLWLKTHPVRFLALRVRCGEPALPFPMVGRRLSLYPSYFPSAFAEAAARHDGWKTVL